MKSTYIPANPNNTQQYWWLEGNRSGFGRLIIGEKER